jgi:CubicO group peptidase (beta-lactamase class C family)
MTKNHITDEIFPMRDSGAGWGLGFEITLDNVKSHLLNTEGSYGWVGAYSTFFLIDPTEQLILILMTHFSPNGSYPTNSEFIVLTYQAIID